MVIVSTLEGIECAKGKATSNSYYLSEVNTHPLYVSKQLDGLLLDKLPYLGAINFYEVYAF